MKYRLICAREVREEQTIEVDVSPEPAHEIGRSVEEAWFKELDAAVAAQLPPGFKWEHFEVIEE